MDSIASFGPSAFRKTAARAAAEGAVVSVAAALLAGRIWTAAPDRKGIAIGMVAAWASSSVSVAWLLRARGRGARAFWRAFGGGMVLRVGVLLALGIWTYGQDGLSFEAVMIAYVFALLALLLTLETRHLKI